MAQSDVDEIAALDQDPAFAPRLPRKPPKPAEALGDEELEEVPSAPTRPTRKTGRPAQNKRKRKDEAEDAGANGDEEDDDSSPRPSPEEVLRLITTRLAVSPEIAGAALGVGRNSAYAAIHKRHIAAFRVGNKLMCPTAPIRRQLGLEPPLPGGEPAPPIAKQKYSRKSESLKPRRVALARASKGALSKKP
jgi:hypothetical protein